MIGQRVVVTGGSGFLGTHVVRRLEQQPWCADVFVPRSREYDLREKEAVIALYERVRPDLVIHLAAVVGGIGANRANPGQFFYDNLMMGVQSLHYAQQYGVQKFVAVGTICSYPKFTPLPFREESLWDGYPEETNAPYGLAKKMLLVQAQAYREQYGLNAISLLPVNLYGPGDSFDLESGHVIPSLIRKFVEAQDCAQGGREPAVVLWGDGSPTREFLFVEDCAEAVVKAAAAYNKPEPINLGSGQEIAIADLARLVARTVGFQGEIVWDTSKPNGQPRRCLDTTRAEREFGWHATTPFEEGLRRTVDWYRAHRRELAGRDVA